MLSTLSDGNCQHAVIVFVRGLNVRFGLARDFVGSINDPTTRFYQIHADVTDAANLVVRIIVDDGDGIFLILVLVWTIRAQSRVVLSVLFVLFAGLSCFPKIASDCVRVYEWLLQLVQLLGRELQVLQHWGEPSEDGLHGLRNRR